MYVDPSGDFAILATILIGTLIGGLIGGVTAAINGDNILAGLAGGAFSGALLTVGMAMALATGGLGGLAISGVFGFAGGATGDIINQGISNNWDNVDFNHAAIVGGVTAVFTIGTFGLMSLASNSAGAFEGVVNKSLSWTLRVNNALRLSPESFIATTMICSPISVSNSLVNLAINIHDSRNQKLLFDNITGYN